MQINEYSNGIYVKTLNTTSCGNYTDGLLLKTIRKITVTNPIKVLVKVVGHYKYGYNYKTHPKMGSEITVSLSDLIKVDNLSPFIFRKTEEVSESFIDYRKLLYL